MLENRILIKIKPWEIKGDSNNIEYQEYTCCFFLIRYLNDFFFLTKEEKQKGREGEQNGQKKKEGRKKSSKRYTYLGIIQ